MTSPYVFLPHRAVLSLDGPDTITMLERLVTHGTADWAPGETRYGALLTPQGKVIADYLALRTETGVLLDVARSAMDDLRKRLTLFRLRADVAIEPAETLFVLAGLEPAPQGARPIAGAAHVLVDPRYPGGRLRAFSTTEEWAGWHGSAVAEWSQPLPRYHDDRIRHGVPEWGADFGTASVFPAAINMDRLTGVDLKKGCFVGQEVVSRMHRRGNIRRRTVSLTIDPASKRTTSATNSPLTSGDKLDASGPIGEITSTEGNLALAQIRVDRLAKAGQDPVTVNGQPVTLAMPDWLTAEMGAHAAND